MNIVWLLLFFGSLIAAWYLGYQYRMRQEEHEKKNNFSRDYLVGLNFLLNEEPDKAVDVFIKMLEVDSDTVETHLAVGKLFRRRGEVDRAIRIHQNLIARPHLDKSHREESLFELGLDYLRAGVLDRAERIFLELAEIKAFSAAALNELLHIYQQEKAWDNAVQTANRLAVISKKDMQVAIAHYYCELADFAFSKNQYEQAQAHVKQALSIDKNSVRASLLKAQLDMKQQDFQSALNSLKRIKKQNPDFLSEAIEPIAACFEALKDEKSMVTYLMQILEEYPRVPIVLILSERIRKWKGDKVAANFVADYVRRYPSISGLHLFINLYMSCAEGRAREDLIILQGLTKKLLAEKPDYQCGSCGFSGKSLHWHCPGCKQWGSVKPMYYLEA